VQQEILDKNPSPRLRVYAIWFNMLPGDSRTAWDGDGLTDRRVVHLWDEQKLAGGWFAAHVSRSPGTDWDAYFLYGPQATWDGQPSPLVNWGSTIIGKRSQLEASIAPLLGSDSSLLAR